MSEWQPIETAPKDRTIIGWYPYHAIVSEGGSIWIMRWIKDEYSNNPKPHWSASGWAWGIKDQRARQPTYWMPLPAPPNTANKGR